jgi:phage major head subunit gpT-like protein
MILTQTNLDALRVNLSDIFQTAFSTFDRQLEDLVVEIPSKGKGNTYGFIAQQLKLRKWIGPRMAQSLQEHAFFLGNDNFEGTVEITLDEIEEDSLGMYTSVSMPQLGVAAALHPEDLLVELINSPSIARAKTFDGKALFANDHPDFSGVGSGTFDNLRSGALAENTLKEAIGLGPTILGEDGKPFGVRYTHLVVPRQLEWTGKELLANESLIRVFGSNTAAATTQNQLKGALKLVVSDLITDADDWYLFDCSKPLKPFIRQIVRKPVIVALDQLRDPNVFFNRKVVYGVDYKGNVAPSLPHLALKYAN